MVLMSDHIVAQFVGDPLVGTLEDNLIIVFIISGLKRIGSVQMIDRIQRIIQFLCEHRIDLVLFLICQRVIGFLRLRAFLPHIREVCRIVLFVVVAVALVLHLLQGIDGAKHRDHIIHRRSHQGLLLRSDLRIRFSLSGKLGSGVALRGSLFPFCICGRYLCRFRIFRQRRGNGLLSAGYNCRLPGRRRRGRILLCYSCQFHYSFRFLGSDHGNRGSCRHCNQGCCAESCDCFL